MRKSKKKKNTGRPVLPIPSSHPARQRPLKKKKKSSRPARCHLLPCPALTHSAPPGPPRAATSNPPPTSNPLPFSVVVTDDARLLWEESVGKQRPRRQGDLTSHPDLRRRSSQIIPNPRAIWGPPPRHCRIPYVGRRQPIARSTVRSSRSTTMPMERGGATRPDLAGWTRLQAVADLCSKRCSYRRAATEVIFRATAWIRTWSLLLWTPGSLWLLGPISERW
nr:uncharacterized protein LOC120966629 [Aegilops tauschii subsp. strangulata]